MENTFPTTISRRHALSYMLGVALAQLSPGYVRAQPERPTALDLRLYTYKNSLWDHAPNLGGQRWGDKDTSVSNWVGRLVDHAADGDSFRERSEFGFVTHWSIPPRLDSANAETADLEGYVANSWKNLGQVNRVMFVVDNFSGWTADPGEFVRISPNESYQDALIRFIDAWEKNAACTRGERTYLIYSGWCSVHAKDPQSYRLTIADLDSWKKVSLGDFQDWFDLLTARLQRERPDVRIVQVPMNRVLVRTYVDTVLGMVPVERMFEDQAHGTETWYCLAGAVFYMFAFGKKVPASYVPPQPAGVDSILIDNWADITDFAWQEINEAWRRPA